MKKSDTFEILFYGSEADPFMVVKKPQGMPSAPLQVGEKDTALSLVLEAAPQLAAVQGKKPLEFGLLHRLDTATQGLLLIALNQKAFDSLVSAQEKGLFKKKYRAQCQKIYTVPGREGYSVFSAPSLLPGFPSPDESVSGCIKSNKVPFEISSFFRPYGPGRISVRPQKKSGGKYNCMILYTTRVLEFSPDTEKKNIFNFTCLLTRGYRHQIRCHLAWTGFPLIGDPLYNPHVIQNSLPGENQKFSLSEKKLQLFATEIEFPHPITGKLCRFSYDI